MRLIEIILIVFLMFVLIGSGVSGQTCTTREDVILRLSANTNAHAEVYNGAGNYPMEICYSQKFDQNYGGKNPPSDAPWEPNSNGDNIILKLSSSTNAHAEDPAGTNYPVSVYYGDLHCTLTANDCVTLGSNYQTIVYLSGQTNAHLSEISSSAYPWKLCCYSDNANPSINCGDNAIAGNEQCECMDGSNNCEGNQANYINNYDGTCSNYNSQYNRGDLVCNGCRIEDTQCESPGSDFCSAYANAVPEGWWWDDNGEDRGITACTNYNLLIGKEGFDYNDGNKREACERDCSGVGSNPSSNGVDPGGVIASGCDWNASALSGNRCYFWYQRTGGPICRIEEINSGVCNEGDLTRTIRIRGVLVSGSGSCNEVCGGEPECERVVPCARAIQLPFFTFYNFAAAVGMTILVYLFINHLNVKKRK